MRSKRVEAFLDAVRDEIDEFTKLGPRQALEAFDELEDYIRARRTDVHDAQLVKRLRRSARKRDFEVTRINLRRSARRIQRHFNGGGHVKAHAAR